MLQSPFAAPTRALRSVLALGAFVAAAWLLTACGPTYPNCSTDSHCKARGEFCLDGKCAQCRIDAHCPGAGTDACVTCAQGACGRKADCCTSKLDCGSGRQCVGNRCIAECAADTDCTGGKKCVAGSCTAPAGVQAGGGCKADTDCGAGLICDSGKCVDSSGLCRPVPVYFDFDEYAMTSSAQDAVSATSKCFKDNDVKSVIIEGHTDERGTDAYNMELGNRRAKAAKEYLLQISPKLKAKTLSYGKTKPVCSEESEACWYRNRRSEFKASDK